MGSSASRNKQVAQALYGFSAWDESELKYNLGQINTNSIANSRVEIINMINLFNIPDRLFWRDPQYHLEKYQPKIYLAHLDAIADGYDYETRPKNPSSIESGSLQFKK